MALTVEVVLAFPERQDVCAVRLPDGATAGDALEASGILRRHPEAGKLRIGIFGKAAGRETPLADGDRVEIYRPLAADPKEARRRRAERARAGSRRAAAGRRKPARV
jgi:hypothetical protein